jgi:predicted DNA-binding protein
MANIQISDELLQQVQRYAQQTGQTAEEVIQEAITDLIETPEEQQVTAQTTLPLNNITEHQLLDELRQKAGKELAAHGITLSEEIIKDRGE